MELCIRSFLIYVLGNISSRFGSAKAKRAFIGYVVYFLVTYTITFESCPDVEIGGDGISSPAALVLCVPPVLAVSYVMARNCHTAWNQSSTVMLIYFGSMVVLILINLVMIYFGSADIRIHLHHHYWAFTLALVCRSSDKASQCGQALALAIFIHGLTVFGCEDLFQWTMESGKEEHFREMCHEWLCPAWKCILPKQ